MAYEICDGLIDLRKPIAQNRVRDFQPPWRTVFDYRCPKCGQVRSVRANAFRGKTPVPGVGAIICGAYIYHEEKQSEADLSLTFKQS